MKNEVIFHDDVRKILGQRQWKSRTDEIMELNKKEESKIGDEFKARRPGSSLFRE